VAGAAAVVLPLSLFLCVRQRYRLHISRAANVKLFLDRLEVIQGELLAERQEEGVRFNKDYGPCNDSGSVRTGGGSRTPGSGSIGSSSSRKKHVGGFGSILSSGSARSDALDLRENVWRWTVDPEGQLSTTDECLCSAVKVLVCLGLKPQAPKQSSHFNFMSHPRLRSSRSSLNADSSPSVGSTRSDREHCERVVSKTLLRLCKTGMFDVTDIRCCAVADNFHLSGFIRSDMPVLEIGRSDHPTVADILPVMCDAADYCILVVDDADSLSGLIGGTVPGDVSRRSPAQGGGRIEDLFLWHASSNRPFGPAVYLAGLAALSLKSERQSYVQIGVDDDGDIPGSWGTDIGRSIPGTCSDILFESLVPYNQRFDKNPATLQLDSEVAGVELHGGLLCLWALNVSHGSFGFVRDAAPLMAELAYLRNYRRSCLACTRRAGFTVSMSDDILQYFQSFRRHEPIRAHSQLKRGTRTSGLLGDAGSSTKRRLGRSARAQHMHGLQACLTHRAMISRCFHVYVRSKCADPESLPIASLCDISGRFIVPSSHPVAQQLHLVTRDVDYMLDKGAGEVLDHVQRYMTLEALADRVQEFLVVYLRKMNGSGDNNIAHKEQLAAFELYAAAAEGQGYLVDVVSDFLCNKAETRGYQRVTKALSDPLKEIPSDTNNELDLAVASTMTSDMYRCSHLFVNFVGASQLPRVRQSVVSFDSNSSTRTAPVGEDTLPKAYCTLGLEGAETVLLQTGVAAQGFNPEWGETLELKQYPPGETLVFNLWHKNLASQDYFLGSALLPYAQFERQEFAGQITLVNTHGGASQTSGQHVGALTVRVSMTAPRKFTRRITRLRSGGPTSQSNGPARISSFFLAWLPRHDPELCQQRPGSGLLWQDDVACQLGAVAARRRHAQDSCGPAADRHRCASEAGARDDRAREGCARKCREAGNFRLCPCRPVASPQPVLGAG